MHDPEGRLELAAKEAIRRCSAPLPSAHFLRSDLAARLVAEGSLVEYRFTDDATLVSPRVPFVSYPHEWCDAQVWEAGRLTLSLGERILDGGWELKDATAWNVIFRGTRPVFCDHLSFQPIASRRWWAFAQFARHFVLPLCLSRMEVFHARMAFVMHGDGLPPERAREVLGARRFLTRCWPLMMGATPGRAEERASARSYHRRLYGLLDWQLGAAPTTAHASTAWAAYAGGCDHYSAEAARVKRSTIAGWLEARRPERVLDLGCNLGEYSRIARDAGACVIAVDLDHDCVQGLYRAFPDDCALFPVIADLADLSGGRGWGGTQYPGLRERLAGFADVTMMLALVHHLAISSAVPYEDIAAFAHEVTAGFLIVELISEDDPMVVGLCAQRRRLPAEFSLARQRAAFARHFRTEQEVALPGMARHVLLLQRE